MVANDAVENESARGLLKQLVHEAQQGLRKVVAVGLHCYLIKSKLKKGAFKPWLAENCPELSYRSLAAYMQLTGNVLEFVGFTINDFLQKCSALHFSHPGEILLLPDGSIPKEANPLREKICTLLDGKSYRQLFLEFKGADEVNGELIEKGTTGDKQWERWMWEFHVERIAEGKVPTRREAKDLLPEFEAYLKRKTAPDPIRQVEADHANAWEDWDSALRKLRLLHVELQHLTNQELDQILNALVETSNLIREMRHPKGKRAA